MITVLARQVPPVAQWPGKQIVAWQLPPKFTADRMLAYIIFEQPVLHSDVRAPHTIRRNLR